MLIFRVFTDAGCVVGFAIRRFRTIVLNHSVIHTLRFPVLRTIAGDGGAVLSRGYRCAEPPVIIVAALSRASHDWRGGGGGSLPPLYETVLRTVSHAFCY